MSDQNEIKNKSSYRWILWVVGYFLFIGFMTSITPDRVSKSQTYQVNPTHASSGKCNHEWQTAKDGSRCGRRAASVQ